MAGVSAFLKNTSSVGDTHTFIAYLLFQHLTGAKAQPLFSRFVFPPQQALPVDFSFLAASDQHVYKYEGGVMPGLCL